MPRDNICMNCGGAFHDDQMSEDDLLLCIYCKARVDSDIDATDQSIPGHFSYQEVDEESQ